ncbi:MAG: CBM57 [uncultured Frankineae bacterium]|uniref:CBM57 n=1 Tax=uncultured Frankineae bacterium TaxID=437475 RepID=A0A6J4LXV9_9ACTN|nr:MAG: CBM57 [uncultured Frankineae bacterium]
MTRHLTRPSRIATIAAGTALAATGTLAGAAPAHAEGETVRLTTAGDDLRDSQGRLWSSTGGFTGGTRSRTAAAISGTRDDVLYRHERYGMSSFSRRVANGTYRVTLKMAEIYWTDDERRSFSVAAEGKKVLRDLDLFALVGKNAAHDRTFSVAVTDGRLDLRFTAKANMPSVSALSLTRTGDATAGAAPEQSSQDPSPPAAGGRPGPDNTGVPAGTELRRHDGDLTITTPGAVYDRLDIRGFVIVKAPDVTIRRSVIRGGVARFSRGLVTNTTSTATDLVVEDSDIYPAHPSVWLDGVKGANFTLRRVDVRGTVDNVKVHGNNVVIEDSWLHDSKHYSSDPHQGGRPSHNDGVQVLGGRNLRIRDNTITGARNAALQVTQDFSATTDLRFTGNYVDGGGCSVNLAHKRLSRMSGITVSANRFGRDTRVQGCAIVATRGTELTARDNVWDDSGKAVRVHDGG